MRKYKDFMYMLLGAFLMAIAMNVFFEPHNLVIGGASGLAVIIRAFCENTFGVEVPLGILFFAINLPLFATGFIVLGSKGVGRSFFASALLSVLIGITEGILPPIKTDMLLAAVFGGVIEGVGLGLVLKGDFTTGGSDLLGVMLSKLIPMPIPQIIFVIDSLVIALGFFEFGSECTLYAIGCIFVSMKVMDLIVIGGGHGKAVYIISDKYEELSELIMNRFERGVTTLKGRGEYTKKDKNVILCVVSGKQIIRLKRLVEEYDPSAFMIITNAAEVMGEGFSDR